MKYLNGFLMLSISLTSSLASQAYATQSPSEQGFLVASELDERDYGFQDSRSNIVMILKDGMGSQTKRELEVTILENNQGGDKSLIKFQFPVDIKGTALLTHPQKVGTDEQWLYLPVVNRTKRISSRNKSGAFMGSEFSFEDMTSKSLEDYTYNYVSEQTCNNGHAECDVIERSPLDKHSGYSKQRLWVDKKDKKVFKIEFYDRKKSLLKVMTATQFKLYDNKYWRATHVEMKNVQTNKATTLLYNTITFSLGLTGDDFHRSVLGE